MFHTFLPLHDHVNTLYCLHTEMKTLKLHKMMLMHVKRSRNPALQVRMLPAALLPVCRVQNKHVGAALTFYIYGGDLLITRRLLALMLPFIKSHV